MRLRSEPRRPASPSPFPSPSPSPSLPLPVLLLLLLLVAAPSMSAATSGSENYFADWSMLGGRPQQPTCVDIPQNMSLCANIGYSKMRLPNLLGHDTLTEAKQQSWSWVPLLQVHCHPDTKLFLCSLFTPVCLEHIIYPCRNLCESVKAACEIRMKTYGYSWPEMFRCDKFPGQLCIELQHEEAGPSEHSLAEGDCPVCDPVTTYENILDNFCRADFVIRTRIRKRRRDKIKCGTSRIYKAQQGGQAAVAGGGGAGGGIGGIGGLGGGAGGGGRGGAGRGENERRGGRRGGRGGRGPRGGLRGRGGRRGERIGGGGGGGRGGRGGGGRGRGGGAGEGAGGRGGGAGGGRRGGGGAGGGGRGRGGGMGGGGGAGLSVRGRKILRRPTLSLTEEASCCGLPSISPTSKRFLIMGRRQGPDLIPTFVMPWEKKHKALHKARKMFRSLNCSDPQLFSPSLTEGPLGTELDHEGDPAGDGGDGQHDLLGHEEILLVGPGESGSGRVLAGGGRGDVQGGSFEGMSRGAAPHLPLPLPGNTVHRLPPQPLPQPPQPPQLPQPPQPPQPPPHSPQPPHSSQPPQQPSQPPHLPQPPHSSQTSHSLQQPQEPPQQPQQPSQPPQQPPQPSLTLGGETDARPRGVEKKEEEEEVEEEGVVEVEEKGILETGRGEGGREHGGDGTNLGGVVEERGGGGEGGRGGGGGGGGGGGARGGKRVGGRGRGGKKGKGGRLPGKEERGRRRKLLKERKKRRKMRKDRRTGAPGETVEEAGGDQVVGGGEGGGESGGGRGKGRGRGAGRGGDRGERGEGRGGGEGGGRRTGGEGEGGRTRGRNKLKSRRRRINMTSTATTTTTTATASSSATTAGAADILPGDVAPVQVTEHHHDQQPQQPRHQHRQQEQGSHQQPQQHDLTEELEEHGQ